MSNYPDGMRESDIPGWFDQDILVHAKCDAKDVEFFLVSPEALSVVDQLAKSLYSMKETFNKIIDEEDSDGNFEAKLMHSKLRYHESLLKFLSDELTQYSTRTDCPFDADQWDVTIDGRTGEYQWDCPICGTEYSDSVAEDY